MGGGLGRAGREVLEHNRLCVQVLLKVSITGEIYWLTHSYCFRHILFKCLPCARH